MLHLQHKSARNRLNLWVKLALLSTVAHVIALFMLLFVYRGSVSDLAFTLSAAQLNNLVDVVFIHESDIRGQKHGQTKKNRSVSQSTRDERVKKEINKKSFSDPKTELKEEKEKKKKSAKLSKAEQRKKREMERKKLEEKKKAEQKKKRSNKDNKHVPQSTRDERSEDKKNIKEMKSKEEQKIEAEKTVKEESIQKNDLNEMPSPVRPESIEGQGNNSDLDFDNIQVYGSYRELEAMQQFQELQQEISRCWRPPVGIAPDVCCQIAVTYDRDGKLVGMEMVKPSGILMFDVSSRNAVTAMEAPKFVRGKTFTITFKP